MRRSKRPSTSCRRPLVDQEPAFLTDRPFCQHVRVDETSGVATVRGFYAAIGERPYEETVSPFLDGQVVWHVAGSNPFAGTFQGIPAVLDAMRNFRSASKGSLRLDTRTLLGDDRHVVAIHEATARVGEYEYAAHEVDVFHVSRGRITQFWSFSEDQAATDRLWTLGARTSRGD